MAYTEFVEVKSITSAIRNFLSGYALQQALPGPTFSFTSFLGGITLGNKGYGIWGTDIRQYHRFVIGINLPGA